MVTLAGICLTKDPDQFVTALFGDTRPKHENRGDYAAPHLACDA
jgi:hypothetical protein